VKHKLFVLISQIILFGGLLACLLEFLYNTFSIFGELSPG